MTLKIIFLGTPAFSVPCLQALLAAEDVTVAGVLTQPDRPAGRGQQVMAPPVKPVAEQAGIPVFQPLSLRKDPALIRRLEEQQPDFLITIAFGQILSQEVLDIPKFGTVNVHASLLPEYRGPNPIQQAIVEGKTETGLTTMLTDIGVDTGPILLQEPLAIGPDETAETLQDRMAEATPPLLLATLRGLASGDVWPIPQDQTRATHAPKGTKADALLDWTLPARVLHDRIRGRQPWPGALAFWSEVPVKILRSRLGEQQGPSSGTLPGSWLGLAGEALQVQTGEGVLELVQVQPPGKKPMTGRDWINGLPEAARGETRFGNPLAVTEGLSPSI